MPRYASETTVSAERSRAEIEETLRRYGATSFHSGWEEGHATVAFKLKNLLVRFILPFPSKKDRRFTHKKVRGGAESPMTEVQREKAYDQEIRQRWRALLLVVKAKLEAVECGISTLEQEFLAFIVLPNDQSVMQWFMEEAMALIRSGQMPVLALPAPPKSPKIVDHTEEIA